MADPQIRFVCEEFRAGRSMSEISKLAAARFRGQGRIWTRNVVVGLVARARAKGIPGLDRDTSVSHPSAPRAPRRIAALPPQGHVDRARSPSAKAPGRRPGDRVPFFGPATPPRPARPLPRAETPRDPSIAPLPLLALAYGQCRWAMADAPGEIGGFLFCAAPVEREGRPWCVHHARRAYQPETPRALRPLSEPTISRRAQADGDPKELI